MQNPFDLARAVYDREPCARPFEEDLFWHLRGGWVVSTPTLFLMARLVGHQWPKAALQSPWVTDPDGDTVFMWVLAGAIHEAVTAVHWPPFQWVGWERSNRPRIYPRDSVLAKLKPVLPCHE